MKGAAARKTTRLSQKLEHVIDTIRELNINRGSQQWKTFRDKAQKDLRVADRKGYSIYSNTGDKMGAFPANAKKSADLQADVWFAASREKAEIRLEGVDGATKKPTTVNQGSDNSSARIAEEDQAFAEIVERLHNLNMDDMKNANWSAKGDISAAEVAKAAAALADAVAAAVTEAGYDRLSPPVSQNDDYEWLCAQLDTPCWRASTSADFRTDGRWPESGVSEAP